MRTFAEHALKRAPQQTSSRQSKRHYITKVQAHRKTGIQRELRSMETVKNNNEGELERSTGTTVTSYRGITWASEDRGGGCATDDLGETVGKVELKGWRAEVQRKARKSVAQPGRCPTKVEPVGRGSMAEQSRGRSRVEPWEGGAKLESTARQAELELQAWRSEVEHRSRHLG
ncbi:hypothetical protein DPX16_13470 [Anabarilius grahami]|uniref:Uncharacterized protein n=1 Tax=Anabarilius grahami TaxID=495550 RepID=A0A3N0YUD0_ANAGA|nr:hypothetical protein DPX16_13470 [Anabarilius grahami]